MIKVMAFDDREKYIIKGVITSKLPEERPRAVLEYIEDKIEKGDEIHINTYCSERLLSILTQLFASSPVTILDIVDDNLIGMFRNDLIYLPYNKQDLIDTVGEKEYKKIFN